MKIGLLGTAHTFHQAPFGDASWELWACNLGEPPRWDRWFQLHSKAVIDGNPGHREWLAAQTKRIYLTDADPGIPMGVAYPLKAMTEKYGAWFFTSTIAFMAALALEEFEARPDEAHEFGLWGVEMADVTEYAAQKNGVRFFLQLARMRGIKLVVPQECELLVPNRLYGFEEPSWLEMKTAARKLELQQRGAGLAQHREALILRKTALLGRRDITLGPDEIAAELAAVDQALVQADRDGLVLEGAIADIDHVLNNWCGVAK